MVRTKRDVYEILQVRPDAHEKVLRAAYRALAGIYHPDADGGSTATDARMVELNDAYAKVRSADLRAAYDLARLREASTPMNDASQRGSSTVRPSANRPADWAAKIRKGDAGKVPSAKPVGGVLDFGRYDGWSIADLARQDPDYLRWLRRHSSGLRFRREIDERLRDEGGPAPIRAGTERR